MKNHLKIKLKPDCRICRFLITSLMTACGATHLFAAGASALPNLQVKEAILCRKVENLCAVEPFADPQSIRARSVALLVTVTGDLESLEWIRANRKIPFKHVWIYTGALSSERENEPIRAGQFDNLPKLESEAETMGRFDWRTTTNKSKLRTGHYEIRIQMANGEPVLMSDGKPAIIHFDYQP